MNITFYQLTKVKNNPCALDTNTAINFNNRSALNRYIAKNRPSGKITGISLAKHGELQFNGRSIWRRHKQLKKGDLVTITIIKGALHEVFDSIGNRIFPLPDSKIYHLNVKKRICKTDGSDPQSLQKHFRFHSKSSLSRFVNRHVRNGIVTKFPLGKQGAMHFLGNRFWDSLTGCKEHDLVKIGVRPKVSGKPVFLL